MRFFFPSKIATTRGTAFALSPLGKKYFVTAILKTYRHRQPGASTKWRHAAKTVDAYAGPGPAVA